MSENVEIYKRVIEAFNEEGLEGAMRYFDPEIEVYDPELPDGGRLVGQDAVRRVFGEVVGAFDTMRVREWDFVELGDRIIALVHTVGAGEGSRGEMEVEIRDAHVMTFRDGQIVFWRLYPSRREALEDVGLDPADYGL